jgi:hypothetical protein
MSSKQIMLLALLTSAVFLWTGGDLKPAYKFKDEMGGSGTTEDGHEFSFHTYKSQDEVWLLTYIEMCPSPELAKKTMDEKVKEASSIIARGPRLDRNGEYLGERVVLTVVKKTQGEAQTESLICWTIGSGLHCIQSRSLKHALAFEKTLYP